MTAGSLPDLRKLRRVLIIRLSAIGDVIHALPLASALRDAHPHLEITWLVEEIPADVVLGNPDLNRVIVVPRARWKRGRFHSPAVWREIIGFLGSLRHERFDLTIDLQGYAKSATYVLAAGSPWRVGWWRMRDGSNLVSRPLPRRVQSVHRVDWFLDVARALGVNAIHARFPIHIPDAARLRMRAMLAGCGISELQRFVVINQAAGNPPRRWSVARFAALVSQLAVRYRLPSVLVGTTPEAEDCEWIVRQASRDFESNDITDVPAPVNLAGATSLKELAALLDTSVLHVSGDTGSTHLAAALQTPVVAIYGSTDPAHAGPWGQAENVVARRDVCSPDCTTRQCTFAARSAVGHGRRALPPSVDGLDENDSPSARCLDAITVEDVLVAVDRVLAMRRTIV